MSKALQPGRRKGSASTRPLRKRFSGSVARTDDDISCRAGESSTFSFSGLFVFFFFLACQKRDIPTYKIYFALSIKPTTSHHTVYHRNLMIPKFQMAELGQGHKGISIGWMLFSGDR